MNEKLLKAADREEWLRMGYTQRMARTTAKEADLARSALHSACSTTTDPKVAAAFAKWLSAEVISKMMTETTHGE